MAVILVWAACAVPVHAAAAEPSGPDEAYSQQLGAELRARYGKALEYGNLGDLPFAQVDAGTARNVVDNGIPVAALYLNAGHTFNRNGYSYYLMLVAAASGSKTYYVLGRGGISGVHSIVLGPVR